MRIICTLSHCSDLVNGIVFTPCGRGMVSDDIPDDVAAVFLTIPGYMRADDVAEAASHGKAAEVSDVEKGDEAGAQASHQPTRRGRREPAAS